MFSELDRNSKECKTKTVLKWTGSKDTPDLGLSDVTRVP